MQFYKLSAVSVVVSLLFTAPSFAQDMCQSALESQEAEFNAINARNPNNGETIPSLQVVLYMTTERMNLLDQYCTGQPQYAEYESLKNSHDSALNACQQIASSTDVCVPTVPW